MADTQPTKYKWYQNMFLIVIGVVIVFAAAAWGSSLFSQYKSIDVTGTFSLEDVSYGKKGDSCDGYDGVDSYRDIIQGAQVTVSNNDANSIIATSSLGEGKVDDSGNCVFSFKVNNVPYSNVYQFQVSHRGQVIYSRQKISDQNFNVDMTLGK